MAILIPSYEPTHHLPEVIRGIQRLDPMAHILVVDDGSGPAYRDLFDTARVLGADVIRLPENRGKGAALKHGMAHLARTAPFEDVITADGDGQHTPNDILRVAAETHGQTALVLGCRAFTGDVPWASRFGNTVSRTLFEFAAGFAVSDTQTGLRGIPVGLVEWAISVPGSRFEYEQNMLLRCSRAGGRVREVEIETVYFDDNSGTHFRPIADSVLVMLPLAAFGLSSLTAFAVDTLGFALLHAALGSIAWSILGARIVSAGVNFAINGRMVFKGHTGGVRHAIIRYVLLALALVAGSIAGTTLLVKVGLPALLAKIVTESVLFLVSFRVQRTLVFPAEQVTVTAPERLPL